MELFITHLQLLESRKGAKVLKTPLSDSARFFNGSYILIATIGQRGND